MNAGGGPGKTKSNRMEFRGNADQLHEQLGACPKIKDESRPEARSKEPPIRTLSRAKKHL